MTNSSRERVGAGDRAAELNEQIAEGHEWVAEEDLGGRGDQHSDAASKRRRAAGKGRSKAETARNEDDK
jgi:hypothetical protein